MIRLALIALLLLLSLLTVLRAPTYHLWMTAIAVSEFPLLPIAVALIFVVWSLSVDQYKIISVSLSVLSLILFMTPIARAYAVAKDLDENFEKTFGAGSSAINGPCRHDGFSIKQMLGGLADKDIPYKTYSYSSIANKPLELDFYPSQTGGEKPCVIVIHGGSWSGGDNKQLPELNSYLAQAGYNVASINYRLAPEYQNPAPVEDVKTCIQYLEQHARELNIDTNNFVLLGRSAGAQIALLAAYTLNDTNIKGVVDFYGPADMVWGYSIPSNPLVMDSRKVMEDYLGGKYDAVPQNYVASSPIVFVGNMSPPTLIIHGQNDVLVSPIHSAKLHKKLDDAGVKNFVLSLPWATHGFDYTLNGPGGQLSTYIIERFLKQVTKPHG